MYEMGKTMINYILTGIVWIILTYRTKPVIGIWLGAWDSILQALPEDLLTTSLHYLLVSLRQQLLISVLLWFKLLLITEVVGANR